ncbi:hypothetical protein BKA58DRAFT_434324 [Alternaria rosae]|uniref:uncharacterized protein n=1 Tax=Alternaria rosae TaxID=1187941 RepID=UPI001E8D6244|nr:uncharacterized protein BKA58DRAFT_434324 [Alternaria rosae]KAH6882566.1 hypothetical protein BKA58DRAFT_434324 [Alternaria rosae]
MAQEQMKNTRKHPLSSAVMPSQRRPFVGPTPNMLPSDLPARFERNATGGHAFLPPMAPHDHNLLLGELSHWPSFPHLNHPFENSYPDLTARRRQHPLPFSMSRNEQNVNLNTDIKRVDPKPPATPAQGRGCTSPADQRHDSLTRGDNTHVSPAPLPIGWNGSRVPSDDVPRKAPLAARFSDDISPFIARKIPQAKQQRSTSQPKATTGPSQGSRVRRQKSFTTPPLGTPKRGRPRLDDGIQDANAAGDLDCQGDDKVSQRLGAQPPIGMFAPPQVSSATPPKPRRPRPKYSYVVPLELLGTQKALGPDNWDEYVYLMEQLWTEEITFDEFGKRTKRIFQVFDESIRKRLNNTVAMKMIVPRLEEVRERGQSTKGTDDV